MRRFSGGYIYDKPHPRIAMVRPILQAVDVRHTVDATRQTTDHSDATLDEPAGKLLCHDFPIGRWATWATTAAPALSDRLSPSLTYNTGGGSSIVFSKAG
jgi:hypothetical protein